ncbi:hypothetical protein C8J57DRAFT_620823 [Mycena rebaudengoi]|nr:hypothetical protein C8J57DRAFT_620823 [Mycena rebaudengoi]
MQALCLTRATRLVWAAPSRRRRRSGPRTAAAGHSAGQRESCVLRPTGLSRCSTPSRSPLASRAGGLAPRITSSACRATGSFTSTRTTLARPSRCARRPHHPRRSCPLHRNPPASRAGSLEPRDSARTARPPMTEDELVLNAQRAEGKLVDDASGMTRGVLPARALARGAAHVSLREGAQDAAERARSQHAHRLCVPRRGGVGGF